MPTDYQKQRLVNAMTQTRISRSQARQLQLTLIDLPDVSPASTTFSARYRGIPADRLSQEDGYLVKWLSSRLEPSTLTLREESALLATRSDRRQVMRLLGIAREKQLIDHLRHTAQMVGKAA